MAHTRKPGENEIRKVVARYEAMKRDALARRDASLRRFAEAGWHPIELQRVTGYSRETIRQALNPQARSDINFVRREERAARSRAARRRFLVPDTLDELQGPTSGMVTLPPSMGADEPYDLSSAAAIGLMYENVLGSATSVAELRPLLNHELLVRVWPELRLSVAKRKAWHHAFPELAGRRWPDPWSDRPIPRR